ncbi:MAG: DUF4113 domain-containing protein [Bordetella sp.]|uniref:DUF4113 domain-containing protein n=1 Tax=Bordetella sp. TaxID=28081 RepID=UPI003F7BAA93
MRDTLQLAHAVDTLNQRFGRSSVAWGARQCRPDALQGTHQSRMTPAATTNWDQCIEAWK